ncbi:hypothetical protein HTZ84_21040 [Haloterrigena sp. SYSU A558-1]|uniref:Uncharacterized protein n=1 Tax=Haloterrigena gelatinilytica TaxID=2741724 RepID=A0ABX2LLT2_9EURY|nr:hypothetical protein [Haloterrigena gelatinilytica]NUC74751.1 hypothetical protein [Haloterrigena gelatinilytica]
MSDMHRVRVVETESEANQVLEEMDDEGYQPVDTAISHDRDSTRILIVFERRGYPFDEDGDLQ